MIPKNGISRIYKSLSYFSRIPLKLDSLHLKVKGAHKVIRQIGKKLKLQRKLDIVEMFI